MPQTAKTAQINVSTALSLFSEDGAKPLGFLANFQWSRGGKINTKLRMRNKT